MTKIIVVSDTHSFALPEKLLKDLPSADMIIHCGDFSDSSVLENFKKFNSFHGVIGNTDDSEIRSQLEEKIIIKCENVSIGVVHGVGAPMQVPDKVEEIFTKNEVDLVCFGHSHFPLIEQRDQFMLFNPGSPNDIVRAPYCSYGLITVEGDDFKLKHIKL